MLLKPTKKISSFFLSGAIFTVYVFIATSLVYFIKNIIFENNSKQTISFYVTNILKYLVLGDPTTLTLLFNPPKTLQTSYNKTKKIKDKDYYSKTFSEIDCKKDLNIGGLSKEINDIISKAFISRDLVYRNLCDDINFKHIKGVLLYGPPGTGKTLIARKLSQTILKADSLKVVNGPELLDKWIGSSEKNIRELFLEAEEDKDPSSLHVVIFDEIDSICKHRSSFGTDAGSRCEANMVNSLLSKMDGFDQLNNILIIGLTNNFHAIDKALLRPGRFELQIEIKLPDREGRKEIFEIYLNPLKKYFSFNFDIEDLLDNTHNYSGADIEGLVKGVINKKMNCFGTEIIENNNSKIINYEDFNF